MQSTSDGLQYIGAEREQEGGRNRKIAPAVTARNLQDAGFTRGKIQDMSHGAGEEKIFVGESVKALHEIALR